MNKALYGTYHTCPFCRSTQIKEIADDKIQCNDCFSIGRQTTVNFYLDSGYTGENIQTVRWEKDNINRYPNKIL